MTNTAILYFPKLLFSSRFGDKFFTFDITDYHNDDTYDYYCCNSQATFYHILVSCGKDSWIVKRRYSEFVTLRLSLFQTILANNNNKDTVVLNTIDLPSLPPKTLLSIINDDIALKTRKEELNIFLKLRTSFFNHQIFQTLQKHFINFKIKISKVSIIKLSM